MSRYGNMGIKIQKQAEILYELKFCQTQHCSGKINQFFDVEWP